MVAAPAALPASPRRLPDERLRRALLAAPLLAVGFAIWAFGGVYAWAFGIAYLMVAAALAGLGAQAARGRWRLRWQASYLPAALLGGLLLAQAPFSYAPAATHTALLHLCAAAAVYLLVSQTFHARDAGWLTLGASLLTAALALLAIVQILTGSIGIYWHFTYTYASPAGSFVNRNHFAGCMEMLLPLACVGAYQRRHRHWQTFLPWAAAPALGVAAVVLAASRGGLAALGSEALAALLLVLYLARRRQLGATAAALVPERMPERRHRAGAGWRRRRRDDPPPGTQGPARLASLLIALALTLGLVGLVGTGRLAARLYGANANAPSLQQRVALDQSTLAMFAQHPWRGWGLGTWAAVYPAFARFDTYAVYSFAHNDYLQLLAETGLAGMGCLLLFWGIWARQFLADLRQWPRAVVERGGTVPAVLPLRAAAALGCFGILVHSWVDFNLHIPANLLLFSVLAALALPAPAGGKD